MRAGPELDAEIARKVFGQFLVWDPSEETFRVSGEGAPSLYSRDEKPALRIVDQMRNDGWAFHYRNDDGGYLAGFSRDDGSVYRSFRAETLPLAICIAALAVGNGTHIQSK